MDCEHQCSGNCRRVGCNCDCGEFHEEKENRVFTTEQEKIIESLKSQEVQND